MSTLHLTILILGALVMVGIYLHWRLTAAGRRDPDPEWPPGSPAGRREPALEPDTLEALAEDDGMPAGRSPDDEPSVPSPDDERAAEPGDGVATAQADPGADAHDQESILVVHLAARSGQRFQGEHIVRALNRHGLTYAPDGVFYRYAPEDPGRHGYLLGVADMLKPGTFDIAEMENVRTVGLVLFSVLPGPLFGTEILDEMLTVARRLADDLDGVLLDDRREPLTAETVELMRERAGAFGPAARRTGRS